MTHRYMVAAAGRASLLAHHLRRTDIREPLNEPNAACVVRACDGSDVVHQHTARSSKSRTGRHPGSASKPQSTQAALAISREQRPHHHGRGDSKGAPALGGPFGRAEGVVHSWMDCSQDNVIGGKTTSKRHEQDDVKAPRRQSATSTTTSKHHEHDDVKAPRAKREERAS